MQQMFCGRDAATVYLRLIEASNSAERLNQQEIRWSQWLESMRKDVECTFGILKGRWRILKAGIGLHSMEAVDNVWHTCCALHNMLLEHDGLDQKWESGFSSELQGELGYFDVDDAMVEKHVPPDAILRLRNPVARTAYDSSGMGRGNTYDAEEEGEEYMSVRPHMSERERSRMHRSMQSNQHSVRIVKDLSLDYFRDGLVEHFHILWSQKKVVWPTRNGVAPPACS